MTSRPATPDPVATLRRILESGQHADVVQMIRERDYVIRRYQPVFDPARLDDLTAETFEGFLRYENNKHWWGLHHGVDRMVANMLRLTAALATALDEDRPLADRMDAVEPGRGPSAVPGLDAAVLTPVMLVVHPDRYGVWSSISESAMRRLGLWPEVEEAGFGTAYEQVNEMLLAVASEVGTDLWTLDALWWGIEKEHDPAKHFVARRPAQGAQMRSRATRPARTPGRSTSARSRRRPAGPGTFTCDTCFQLKQLNLESGTPGRCVDCA